MFSEACTKKCTPIKDAHMLQSIKTGQEYLIVLNGLFVRFGYTKGLALWPCAKKPLIDSADLWVQVHHQPTESRTTRLPDSNKVMRMNLFVCMIRTRNLWIISITITEACNKTGWSRGFSDCDSNTEHYRKLCLNNLETVMILKTVLIWKVGSSLWSILCPTHCSVSL